MQINTLTLVFYAGIAPWFSASANTFCAPSIELQRHIRHCAANLYFVEATDACAKKFEHEINAEKLALSASFSARHAKTESAQKLKLTEQMHNLNDTSGSFDSLIAKGEKARAEMLGFSSDLLLPGAPTPEMIFKYKLTSLFADSYCYGAFKKKIHSRLAQLDAWLEDLQRINAELKNLNGQATTRTILLNGKGLPAAAARAQPVPLSSDRKQFHKGKSKKLLNSTITGPMPSIFGSIH